MCTLTSGLTLGCKNKVGGARAIYIANWTDGISYTYGTSSVITGITYTGTTQSFYQFEQPKNQISYTDPVVTSIDNQTTYYDQTLTFNVYGRDAATLAQLEILATGAFRVLIQAMDGKYFLMGEVGPVQCSVTEGGLGKVAGDMVGDIVTMKAEEPHKAREVESAVALALISS